ncbi:phospholipid-transporting ATPase ABCA3-like isoform X2 [Ostrinia nubilalis]|uniref:phospholipid-transporting ATPase ABCA3-like isoform X2 n=1 Tax=Ostrinia nubilalis TaxID=29057 RepID=UPI0030826A9F
MSNLCFFLNRINLRNLYNVSFELLAFYSGTAKICDNFKCCDIIMPAYEKLNLLIWKNLLLQRRHKWQTLFEIASPVIFSLFLILVRCLVDPQSKPAISYPPFQPTYFNMSGQSLGNLTTTKREGTLAFSPENPLTRKVTEDAMATVALDNLNGLLALLFDTKMLPQPKGFKNAAEMEVALTQPNIMNQILVGIQYDDSMANASKWPDDIVVTLRFPAVMRTPMVEHPLRASWRTNLLFPLFPRPGPRDADDMYGGKTPGYSPEMFLAVQHAVSKEIIKQKSGKPLDTKVYLQRLPQSAYRNDDLLIALERFISMIIMLCFAYTFVNTVRVVTAEKELQLKETMTIMGLPSWLHWLAWFIKQFSFLLISVVLMVILFKIPFNSTSSGDRYAVLTFTPCSVLLFFMVLFVIASLAFCFMVSVFFTRANTAASFMGLAWFSTYSVFMLTQVLYEDISLTTKLVLSLISNTAMGYAFQMIIMCEGTSRGLQWSEFFSPVSYHDQYKPAHVALMLVVDAILYMLIAMYVEKIRPGLYGVPLPWYFPFTKSFWMPNKNKKAELTKKEGADLEYNDALLKVVHDEEPKGVPMGVNIQNLTKIYSGRKKAVDNLNLRMYENEITVLLGHNGAGKTTTISMLTGMVPPSSGSATINGYNIVSETELARKSLGICPQHNVLFPDLTVAEHIIFYSRLKGVPENKINEEVNHFVKLLELEQKRDVVSDNLSGGQKRRLSVGAAMCGSSRVVLLDEPTSGLDPAARRALWDLLQKEKKGRTMILTTHFMDEADVLGDRIAIMSGGRLQCVGTPYFLKKHYGIGYKLTIVKGENCNVEDVTRFFKTYVPDLKENTNIGSELTYILPNDYVSKFPDMLKEFENKRESLHVSSYGLSVTSLEEVFMKAGAEDNDISSAKRNNYVGLHNNDCAIVPVDGHINTMADTEPLQKVRGFRLLKNHIKAMFLKLSYNTMRNKLTAFIQFVTPIINITISVIIARSWKFMSQLPPLTLSLESGFRETQTLMSQVANLSDSSVGAKAMNAFKDYFKTSTYPGMQLADIGTMDLGKFYLKLSAENLARVRYENLVGATFAPNRITGWFSNYGYHDSAISLALINDAIIRAVAPGSSLKIVNHPLPYSIENLVRVMASGSSMGFQFAFNIGFCMAFVTSFLVLFVIKERISGAKLLQRVSGVRPAVLWGTAFIWDWIWLLLIYLCIVITLACFQENTLSTPSELGRVLLVLMVFSLATVPLHYLASFYFEAAATGFSKMCFMNIFCGCMPFLITEVLRLPEVGSPYYAHLFDWIFSPLPIYCISRSFRDMSVSSFSMMACDGLCEQFVNIDNCTRHMICTKLNISVCCIEDDPFLKWSEPGIGRYLFMMSLVGILALTLLLIKEYKLMNKVFYSSSPKPAPPVSSEEDSDVVAERRFVQALTRSELGQYSLVCKDLTKYYQKFLAVNRLTFAVRKAECFGLLGVNGAGKTSTFRMLTGDAHISSGDAHVHGLSIKTNIQDVHRHIGYCPQFDALFDNLTARETLRIFCLLRGIPPKTGAMRALHLATTLGFLRHYDKKVQECSGGTKRKISTAVALLGDSPLVFLDEPTTGMDPASKRLVWSCISDGVSAGRSIVLTSHSMEECEALCSRLTVMVNGRLYCLGPLQHLKSKFSQGYTLIVKCKTEPDRDKNVANVNQYINENFSDAKLIETYLGISTYYLNDADLPWWRVFHVMEEARTKFSIEDYSVSQTTLEQVFLRFTRLQGNIE